MIVEITPSALLACAGIVGAVCGNVLAIVRLWHRIELRLALIEDKMEHIERNTMHAPLDGFR